MTTTKRNSGSRYSTHDVTNQPPPLVNYNLFTTDGALKDSVAREGGSWGEKKLAEFGELAGSEQTIDAGFQANK